MEVRKRELYNPDDIFKNRNKEYNIEENSERKEANIIEYKESILKKVINKIKRFFHIGKNY